MDVRRPAASAALVAATTEALMWAVAPKGTEPLAYVVPPLAAASLVVFLAWNGSRLVNSFLRGLRDIEPGLIVLSDVSAWFGDRRIRVRTSAGEWNIQSWNGGSIKLDVTPPGHRTPLLVQRRYRKTARELIQGKRR